MSNMHIRHLGASESDEMDSSNRRLEGNVSAGPSVDQGECRSLDSIQLTSITILALIAVL